MKSLKLTVVIVMFFSSAMASELPPWQTAKRVMKKCYSGYDAVVTLDASLGAKARYTRGTQGISLEKIGGDSSSSRTTGVRSSSTNGTLADELGTLSSVNYSESLEDSLSESSSNYDGFSNYDYAFDEASVSPEAFVGVKLTVPLYSRADRLSRREKTAAQVKAVADLYARYEGYKATAAALTEEGKVLRSLMLEGGENAISAYFGLLAEKEKSIALMVSAHRTILHTLESCGYKGE